MAKRSPKLAAKLTTAAQWQGFYAGAGRAAIAALFTEFNLYTPLESNDPHAALRAGGQRDVLLHIVQLLGLKPELFVDVAWEDTNILDRMMHGQ